MFVSRFPLYLRFSAMVFLCVISLRNCPADPPSSVGRVKSTTQNSNAQNAAPKATSTKAIRPKATAANEQPIRQPDPSDAYFASRSVAKLRIEIVPAELQKLRENNRTYVRCDLIENGKVTYKSVAIKLKGAAGSFRDFDDRPALTLNVDRFNKEQSFHGLEKIHLNNSVQDESYLNEYLCSELCREMKIPAARVTHARVWLNGRDVGLYVVKEGFDKTFLKRHFADAKGNLYDGGFLQDVDVDLEKDSGIGPDDRSDLHALREACAELDPVTRWQRIVTLLDVDRFIDFMALELMTCHWDGYTVNKNNYRLYFDFKSKKGHFFPHGMDQMFGDAGFPILDHPGCIVSSAVMQNPAWRARYRARIKEFLPLFSPPERLLARVAAQQKRLLPIMKEISDDQANAFQDRVNELQQRLIARAENLKEQVAQPEPGPVEFNDEGFVDLSDWYGVSETEDAIHEEVELAGPQKQAYSIKVGSSGNCVASWRRKVLLARGQYQFLAEAKTENVMAKSDEQGSGVGLRLSGMTRSAKLAGTSNWKPLVYEFEIVEDQKEVELVAEIRATAGQVWFNKASLRLKRQELAHQ